MPLTNKTGLRKWKWVIYVISVLFLSYSIFPCIGYTHDSNSYVEMAKSLPHLGFWQAGFKAKPPLFPIILFALDQAPFIVSFFNLLCFTLSVVLIEKKLKHLSFNNKQQYFISIWIAFSTPLFLVHNFIWTEPLFLVLILLFFSELDSSNSYRLVKVSILAILIVALKHTGILVIATGVLLLLYRRKYTPSELLWVLSAVCFFIVWQWFVFYLRGDLERLDHLAGLDFKWNYYQLGKHLSHWIIPFDIAFLNWIAPVLFLVLMVIIIRISQHFVLQSFALLAVLNVVMILLKGDLIAEDSVRYLFFIHPFLLAYLFLLFNRYNKLKPVITILTIVLILYSLTRTIKNALVWHEAFC